MASQLGLDSAGAGRRAGDVRELHNLVERAVLLCKGETVEPDDIVLGRSEHKPWK